MTFQFNSISNRAAQINLGLLFEPKHSYIVSADGEHIGTVAKVRGYWASSEGNDVAYPTRTEAAEALLRKHWGQKARTTNAPIIPESPSIADTAQPLPLNPIVDTTLCQHIIEAVYADDRDAVNSLKAAHPDKADAIDTYAQEIALFVFQRQCFDVFRANGLQEVRLPVAQQSAVVTTNDDLQLPEQEQVIDSYPEGSWTTTTRYGKGAVYIECHNVESVNPAPYTINFEAVDFTRIARKWLEMIGYAVTLNGRQEARP